MASRTDPRYTEHGLAVLAAYIVFEHENGECSSMDMGHWTDTDEDAFREAVRDEYLYGAGEPLPNHAYIVIEPAA